MHLTCCQHHCKVRNSGHTGVVTPWAKHCDMSSPGTKGGGCKHIILVLPYLSHLPPHICHICHYTCHICNMTSSSTGYVNCQRMIVYASTSFLRPFISTTFWHYNKTVLQITKHIDLNRFTKLCINTLCFYIICPLLSAALKITK